MKKNPPVIGLIPARRGSKGIIGKNMRIVAGVPLIDFSIQAALKSSRISKVYVSSDDIKTLKYAANLGCETLLRPPELADDFASANDVILHFFNQMGPNLRSLNPILVYLQPTSPLRTAVHIDEAIEEMLRCRASSSISVRENEYSPYKSFSIDSSGCLNPLFSEEMTNKRRQDLDSTYVANGALYIFSLTEFCKKNAIPSEGAIPYIMDSVDSLDIDDENDIEIFERVIRERAD